MSLLPRLLRRSVTELVRLACLLALAGLAIMSYAVLSGRPLAVILAMTVGHGVGLASLGCFLLAVLIDEVRRDPAARPRRRRTDTPDPAE